MMMGKNGYLAKRKIRDNVMQDAIRQTYQQYMTDTLILTLNDPGSWERTSSATSG